MEEEHREWLERVTSGASFREIGEKSGLHNSAIVRSLNRNGLSTEQVVRIAVAYKVPIVDALVDTGRIEAEDIEPTPERIAETISYLAKKLAVQAHPKEERPAEQNNVVQLPSNDVAHDFYSDEIPEDAVAYPHKELGGSLDDLDP